LENKNSHNLKKFITDKDYFGATVTVRLVLILCFSFALVYAAYSTWQINQWTKKQQVKVFRLSQSNLNDLSQWVMRAALSNESKFVATLKKYIANKPHIRQARFEYKDKQIFSASTPFEILIPALVDKVIKTNDRQVSIKVTSGIIDLGSITITTNSDYIKGEVWNQWVAITMVVCALLFLMLFIMYLNVRKSFKVLRAIAVCGQNIDEDNFSSMLREGGQGEALAASKAINRMLVIASSQSMTVTDISYSMRTEIEKNKKASKYKESAEVANTSKSEYLAKISEEFRPPLNNILALTEMSSKPEFKAQEQHFLDMIHASAIQLDSFVDSIIDIAQIETDSISIENSIFDYRELMRVIRTSVEPLVAKQNKSFEMIVDNDIPAYLIADEKRLQQVVLSLVCDLLSLGDGNTVCVKASVVKTDVVSVTIQFDVYTIDAEFNSNRSLIHKTESDQSVAESLCNTYGKSGIGRVITKKLIKAMEGKLDIKKIKDRVQSYTINLRLGRPSQSLIADYEKTQSSQGRLSGKTLRVLLADSHLINRYVFELVFFHKGHVTLKAENGEEALRIMREEEIDFAILDTQLPVMNGLSVAHEWRKNESKDSYLPIIITSNDTRMEMLHACAEVADFVETKPVSPYTLLTDIELYRLNPSEEKRPVVDLFRSYAKEAIIDLDYFNNLKKSTGENELSNLVSNFYSVFEDEFEKFKKAVTTNEINAYRTLSQRLKGGTNTIGAKALGDQFSQIQALESSYIVAHKVELIDSILMLYTETKREFSKALNL